MKRREWFTGLWMNTNNLKSTFILITICSWGLYFSTQFLIDGITGYIKEMEEPE